MGSNYLSIATFAMSVYEGMNKQQTANLTASAYEIDAKLLEIEASSQADRIESEGKRFEARQKLAYISSGVQIGGSAVVTLAQTDKWIKADAQAVRNRGRATRAYYQNIANVTRSQGRASFISSIVGGATRAYGIQSTTRSPGTMGTKMASD